MSELIVAFPVQALQAQSLVIDPISGFLTPKDATKTQAGNGSSTALVFTTSKKQECIDLLRKCWPNISAACRQIGITKQTFRAHLAVDEKLRREVQEIQDQGVDEIEGNMMTFGRKPKNYLDRITIARAYRPEVFDPAKRVEITHQREMTDTDATEVSNRAAAAVDAEIVHEQFRPGRRDLPPGQGMVGEVREQAGEDPEGRGEAES